LSAAACPLCAGCTQAGFRHELLIALIRGQTRALARPVWLGSARVVRERRASSRFFRFLACCQPARAGEFPGKDIKISAQPFIRGSHTCGALRRGTEKRNDMDSAKRCRDQSAECHRLMKLAQSETEARVLRDLAQSWVRLANQTNRYTALVKSNGPHHAEVMLPQGTGVAPRSGTKFAVAHQRFR
jgi:hypothetical protein